MKESEAMSLVVLRSLTCVGISSKTGSDTFKSVLLHRTTYGKEQESWKKIFHNLAKNHLPEKV